LFLGHQKKIMLAIDKFKRLNGSMRRLSSSGGHTTCAEVLPPPTSATFNDVTYSIPASTSSGGSGAQYFGALNSMSAARHYEDPYFRPMASSGEGINRMDHRSFPQNCPSASPSSISDAYGRSLTPIQVQVQNQPKPLQSLLRQSDLTSIAPGRFSSMADDGKDQPSRGPVVALHGRCGESDGDTTPTNERKTPTSTVEEREVPLSISHYDVPYVSSNAIDSPLRKKLLAKVMNKTKLSSCMMPMDMYQMSNEEASESETRTDPYSYNYSTLPRKFSAKRKIADGHVAPGYNWADDNNALLTNRQPQHFGINPPVSMGDFRNQSSVPQQSLDGSAAGSLSGQGFRNFKDAPAPPKRTNSFKTDLRAVYASVIDRTKYADNKNSFMGIDSYDKICESEIFNNLSTVTDYHRNVRTESDCVQSPQTLARFNQQLLRPKLSNRVDLASSECLRGAFERLEQNNVAQLEELGALGDFENNSGTLKKREDNSQGRVSGPEIKSGNSESKVSGPGTSLRGGPKLGDWQDNRSNSSSGGDCSSDDSDSGLDSRRSGSTISLDSGSLNGAVGDTNTLPFANENVGTIKQRNGAIKPSIVADNGNDLNEDMFTDNMGTIKLNKKPTMSQESDSFKGAVIYFVVYWYNFRYS